MPEPEQKQALEEIGKRVRQRRRALGLTQEQLADAARLSKSFVSELEGGQTAANGLVYLRLAQALDVEVQWLLTGEETAEASAPGPVKVPPLLSEIAEEKGWSHRQTLDVAAALDAITARRTRDGRHWDPDRELILRIAKVLAEQ